MNKVKIRPFYQTILLLSFLAGCNQDSDDLKPKQIASSLGSSLPFQHYTPVGYLAFDVMINDMDHDQKEDLILVDHRKNQSQVLFQKDAFNFTQSPFSDSIGFHPGNIIPWDPNEEIFVVGGEGTNSIRGLKWGGEKFDLLSTSQLRSPRWIEELHWPGWGRTLVSSPYSSDQIDFLKGYDPRQGRADSHEMVPLAKNRPSIREPNRLTLVDINGDGIEEILMALRISKEIMVIRYPGKPTKKTAKKPIAEVLATNDRWAMPNNLAFLDIDRKNGPDLLFPDEIMPGMLHILMNDGKGSFKEAPDVPLPGQEGATSIETAVEKMPDGSLKGLVALSSTAGLTLFEVTEKGVDDPWRHWTVSTSKNQDAHRIEIIDLNHDGVMDLVALYPKGVWVVEGPLIERFEEMASKGYRLMTE